MHSDKKHIKKAKSAYDTLQSLQLRKTAVKFAENDNQMRTILSSYATFSELLEEREVIQDESLSFEEICDYMGADSRALDALLREELGFTGEEVLSAYRTIDN